ncbi:hypothetical protein DEGR_17980 [Deinococcus grandis]|nr:hypothetical protein DEGR_17980 [Deinococcus grandis]
MDSLNLPLAVTLAVLAAYWLGRVIRAARSRLAPRVTYWAAPGLGALLLAPLLDVPALFGVGAGLMLLAETGRRRSCRPAAAPVALSA